MWTVLILIVSVFFLSHCSPTAQMADPTAGASVETCLAGVYSGSEDIRFNNFGFSGFFSWFSGISDQDLNVSIAFSGDNAVLQVKGDHEDMLCTHYVGVKTEEQEGAAEGTKVLSASQITSSRKEGTTNSSETIPQSFGNITFVVAEDNPQQCDNFKISAFEDLGEPPELDTIISEKLSKNLDQTADYNTLLEDCGGLPAFSITLPQEEEAAAEIEAYHTSQAGAEAV